MNWYKFHAYNSQALYGFGSADEASLFVNKLNKHHEINYYAAKRLDAHDVWGLGLEESPESFNIADELAEEGAR